MDGASLNGLWSVAFAPDGGEERWGVIVISKASDSGGYIDGGDGDFCWRGRYTIAGRELKLVWFKAETHSGEPAVFFGPEVLEFKLQSHTATILPEAPVNSFTIEQAMLDAAPSALARLSLRVTFTRRPREAAPAAALHARPAPKNRDTSLDGLWSVASTDIDYRGVCVLSEGRLTGGNGRYYWYGRYNRPIRGKIGGDIDMVTHSGPLDRKSLHKKFSGRRVSSDELIIDCRDGVAVKLMKCPAR